MLMVTKYGRRVAFPSHSHFCHRGSMTSELPTDRRISGHRLRTVLGTWQRHRPGLRRTGRRTAGGDPVGLGAAEHPAAERARAGRRDGRVPDHHHGDLRTAARRGLPGQPSRLRDRDHAAERARRPRGVRASRTTTSRASSTCRWLPRRPRRSCTAAYLAALDELPRHLAGTGYAPLGLPVLREAIADWYTRRGTPTTPDQILVTTGAQQAIHLLVHAHAGPGDRVVVEHPTYPHAIDVVRGAGARPVPVPSGERRARHRPAGVDDPAGRPAARLPDPRPPQPDGHVARRRRARRGARAWPAGTARPWSATRS